MTQMNAEMMLNVARAVRQVATPHEQYDGDRDFAETFSYIKDPDFQNFKHWYEHDPVAGRVVDGPPADMWQEPPEIKATDENGEAIEDAEFNEAVRKVDEKVGLMSEFRNVDQQARIGRWGTLFVGLDDVTTDDDLAKPADPDRVENLLFIKSYDEGNAPIMKWDRDPTSARNGLPEFYSIDQDIPTVDEDRIDQERIPHDLERVDTDDVSALTVHHSRVVHVAEDAKTNPAVGRPVLKRILNRLIDKVKVVGATGEGYYQVASPRYIQQIPEDFEMPDPDSDAADNIQAEVESWVMGFKELLTMHGDVEAIGGEDLSPEEAYEVILSECSIGSNIPKTRLKGNETGDRASDQNSRTYNRFLDDRKHNHATPNIIRPTIDKLISWGILPNPENGYTVDWPDTFKMTELEKAQVKVEESKAIKNVSPAGQTDLFFEEAELRRVAGQPGDRPSDQQTNAEALRQEDILRQGNGSPLTYKQ